MSVSIYGIKNCDTMKKALRWLDAQGVSYEFHEYKKEGADEGVLRRAIDAHGWDVVINRRGTTWRKLSDDLKNNMDADRAIAAALENPSLIKRPLLVKGNQTHLGFKDTEYEKLLG